MEAVWYLYSGCSAAQLCGDPLDKAGPYQHALKQIRGDSKHNKGDNKTRLIKHQKKKNKMMEN